MEGEKAKTVGRQGALKKGGRVRTRRRVGSDTLDGFGRLGASAA